MRTLFERTAAYLFASWHLRQLPLCEASADERARWVRDHAGQFAGRWFAIGAGFWLLFMTPFVRLALVAFIGLFGLTMGIWHIVWQIVAQKRVGPPTIDPPVDFDDPNDHPNDSR
ncbi:MAG: hypothetical protein RI539_02310 [Spiribacter sp.]|jgi:cadmium resistance protein CadD (predicted permease)|nr:hypothetical protein [Spiribacter sp.]MDR9489159.1 hypothetical protein [Spiribacter sp.]